MKTVPYQSLDNCLRAAARQRVSNCLDIMARAGRVCVESSVEVARRANFQVTSKGGIWGVILPNDMRTMR
jgi:hypothetical protein